jgi:hypothetical protein
VISLFVSFTEITLGAATTQTTGGVQVALTAFVIVFPMLVAAAFFAVLWARPWAFYSPQEYSGVDARSFIEALQGKPDKIVTETKDLGDKVETFGQPDRFQLLFKAKGGNWKKSTKAMEAPEGCILQVSTEQMNIDGTWAVAEAVTYVPGTVVVPDETGSGRHLASKVH